MVGTAGEKQLVRVGPAAVRPVRRMMHFAVVTGLKAIGSGAAAVTGITDEPLIRGRDALLPPQIQGPAGVLVEHRQIVNCLGCHANQVRHRQS